MTEFNLGTIERFARFTDTTLSTIVIGDDLCDFAVECILSASEFTQTILSTCRRLESHRETDGVQDMMRESDIGLLALIWNSSTSAYNAIRSAILQTGQPDRDVLIRASLGMSNVLKLFSVEDALEIASLEEEFVPREHTRNTNRDNEHRRSRRIINRNQRRRTELNNEINEDINHLLSEVV